MLPTYRGNYRGGPGLRGVPFDLLHALRHLLRKRGQPVVPSAA